MIRDSLIAGRWALGLALLVSCGFVAERAQAQQAEATFRDAANFQNAKEYSLAIDEWNKFLKDNPTHKQAVQAQHYLGVCYMQLKEPDNAKAIAAFEGVLKAMDAKEPPKHDQLEETYLNLGWLYFNQGAGGKKEPLTKAATTFEAMLKKFPEGKQAADGLWFLGEAYYQAGEKEKAATTYKSLLDKFPKGARKCDALYALGSTYEELGKYDQAGPIYDTFLAECKESELFAEVGMRKAETIFQAGLAAEKANNAEQAKKSFTDAEKGFAAAAGAKDFKAADHALSRQAFCLSRLGKSAEAAALYAKLATDFPQSPQAADANLTAGRLFNDAKNPDEARKFFEKVVAAGGAPSVEAAHWLCKIELAAKQPAKAYELATKTLAGAKEGAFLPQLKLDQADALYEQPNEKAKSIDLYLKIASDSPDDAIAPQALYNAAYTALEVDQHDAGLKHAQAFLDKYKSSELVPEAKYVIAECSFLSKKYAEAEKIYSDIVATHKDSPRVPLCLVRQGYSLFLQDKRPEAITALTAALPSLKTPDQTAEAQYLIGMCQLGQDKADDAAKAFAASLAANGMWRSADASLMGLANAQFKAKKYDDAKTAANRLLAEFKESKLGTEAQFRLAEIALAQNDHAGAAAAYDKVTAGAPQSIYAPHALYGKGLALYRQNEHAKAAEAFTSLLAAHADHALAPRAHSIRATCRHAAGDFKGAIEDIAAFLKSNPNGDEKSDAIYLQGLCQSGLKDYPAAIGTLEGLAKDQPNYSGLDKVLYELAWSQKLGGKEPEAAATFARLAKEKPDSSFAPEAIYHQGQDQYTQKKYADAAKLYDEAKAAFAKTKSTNKDLGEKIDYKLGWSLFYEKKYEPARNAFQAQLNDYPQGSLAGEGQFMIAECLFKQEKFGDALKAYDAAKGAKAPTPEIEALILLHGGQSAGQEKKWEDSLKWFGELMTKHPKSPYLAEALYEQGVAQQKLNKNDDALKTLEEAATKAVETNNAAVGARARFMLGEVHFQKKDFATAVKEFVRVMYGFGGEGATDDVRVWQAKAGYEAGRCLDVQIKDEKDNAKRKALVADALKYYNYVVDKHPQSMEKSGAAERIKELSKL